MHADAVSDVRALGAHRSPRSSEPAFERFSGPSGLTFQPGLDGLRGLAVGAVVLFHLGFGGVTGGYLGVSLFFTLSGMLIGSLVLNEVVATGRFSLRRFWLRRARRLLPPALVTLAVIAIARHMTTTLQATSGGDVVAAALNVANWHFLAEGASYGELFGGPSAVLHFWSLAIEEQFYLAAGVLSVLLAVRSSRPIRTVGVVAAAVAACSFATPFVHRSERRPRLLRHRHQGGRADARRGRRGGVRLRAASPAHPSPRVTARPDRGARARRNPGALGRGDARDRRAAERPPAADRRAVDRRDQRCAASGRAGVGDRRGRPAAVARPHQLRRVPDPLAGDRRRQRGHRRPVAAALGGARRDLDRAGAVQRAASSSDRSGGNGSKSRYLAAAASLAIVSIGTASAVDGRTTDSADLLERLSDESVPAHDPATAGPGAADVPRVALFGDSVGFSMLLALGQSTAEPGFVRAPSDVNLGCGIAVSPLPPPDQPHLCDNPADRFALKAIAGEVDVAIMISCQWELLPQTIPGTDHEVTIGEAEMDAFIRDQYVRIADRLAEAGVDRVLWMTCPYMSMETGFDTLSPRFAASRRPERIDRLNAIITEIADSRDDVDVLPFADWVNERRDDPALRPDGSHYEFDTHNPAADAFIELLNESLRGVGA